MGTLPRQAMKAMKAMKASALVMCLFDLRWPVLDSGEGGALSYTGSKIAHLVLQPELSTHFRQQGGNDSAEQAHEAHEHIAETS